MPYKMCFARGHRMLARALSLGAVAAVCLPAAAQVYKCPDATGRTVIQQTPCAGGQALNVRPASGHGTQNSAADAQARLAKLKADNAMAEAIRKGVPLVGMTAAQLQQAMGQPSQVNPSNYGGTRKDQLVYYRPNATWYVYTTNGVVDSIQQREPMASAAPRPAEHCPTAHEIRDAEVSASSITLSAEEREARWRAIERMRACGRR